MKKDNSIMVTRPFMPKKAEYKKYIDEIWNNKWLTNKGPLFYKFHSSLQKYLNVKNISLTVNGHSALDIAIKALGIHGEVITTPFTFASTTHALVLNGITPVFCDIKESDLTIDENKIESLITDKTTAIMPVHVYGHICNINKIEKIAKKYNLKVIYDAAHAFGISKNGVSVANCGDASIFSFHATKLFHTIEGGCIIYKNKELEPLFSAYRNFGIYDEESIPYVGGNSKMNEFQAAMGLTNLKYIDDIIEKRKRLTLYYRNKLDKIKNIKYFIPEKLNDYDYNYGYLPILVFGDGMRNYLYDKLKEYNIFTRKYFYPLITDFECYRDKFTSCDIPISKRISEQVLCLPLYYDLTFKEIRYICDCIKCVLEDKYD